MKRKAAEIDLTRDEEEENKVVIVIEEDDTKKKEEEEEEKKKSWKELATQIGLHGTNAHAMGYANLRKHVNTPSVIEGMDTFMREKVFTLVNKRHGKQDTKWYRTQGVLLGYLIVYFPSRMNAANWEAEKMFAAAEKMVKNINAILDYAMIMEEEEEPVAEHLTCQVVRNSAMFCKQWCEWKRDEKETALYKQEVALSQMQIFKMFRLTDEFVRDYDLALTKIRSNIVELGGNTKDYDEKLEKEGGDMDLVMSFLHKMINDCHGKQYSKDLICHEILLKPTSFQISTDPMPGAKDCKYTAAHVKKVDNDITQGIFSTDFKMSLLELYRAMRVVAHGDKKEMVDELFDIFDIGRRITTKTKTLAAWFEEACKLLMTAQTSQRAEETKQMWAQFVKKETMGLHFLLERVRVTFVDNANKEITRMAPFVAKNGVAYMRKRYHHYYDHEEAEETSTWLLQHVTTSTSMSGSSTDSHEVFARAMASVFTPQTTTTTTTISRSSSSPNSLTCMDNEAIERLQKEFNSLVSCYVAKKIAGSGFAMMMNSDMLLWDQISSTPSGKSIVPTKLTHMSETKQTILAFHIATYTRQHLSSAHQAPMGTRSRESAMPST